MGRVDDRESEEARRSEPEEEKDNKDRDTSEADEGKDTEKDDASDSDSSAGPSAKKYKCKEPGCSARFLRPSRLTWHMRKHKDERPYKCDQEGCTRAYTNSSHLKRHLNTTHKPVTKTYACEECGTVLGSLFSLKRHNKKIHDPTRLTCTECGATFRKKHCYNEHLSMHAGVAMYKCDNCDQSFTTLRLYKKHHRVHESLKTYPCTSIGCSDIFDKWSKLSKHLATEHEFDYKCEKCEKQFKRKRQLQAHSEAHTREGTVVVMTCPYKNCPRFYSYKRNLDEHVLSVHLGRKFICDTCNHSFAFKSAIARHIQVVHEGKDKRPLKRKRRRRRKDAGVYKKSMLSKLVGLELPTELEKRILCRKSQVQSADKSEYKDKAAESGVTSEIAVTLKNNVKEGFFRKTEEKNREFSNNANDIPAGVMRVLSEHKPEQDSFPQIEKYNQVILSTMPVENGTSNNESEAILVVKKNTQEIAGHVAGQKSKSL